MFKQGFVITRPVHDVQQLERSARGLIEDQIFFVAFDPPHAHIAQMGVVKLAWAAQPGHRGELSKGVLAGVNEVLPGLRVFAAKPFGDVEQFIHEDAAAQDGQQLAPFCNS